MKPDGNGRGTMPGAIALSMGGISALGDGSAGSGSGGSGGAIAGGDGGRSRPPTRFPTAGIAEAIAGMSDASGPNPNPPASPGG